MDQSEGNGIDVPPSSGMPSPPPAKKTYYSTGGEKLGTSSKIGKFICILQPSLLPISLILASLSDISHNLTQLDIAYNKTSMQHQAL